MRTLTITIWRSLFEPAGRSRSLTWEALATRLSRPAPCPLDVEHPTLGGWAAAELRDNYRDKGNVVAVHALALDFDKYAPTVESILAACGRRRLLVHSTRRYTPAEPRFRAVLDVSRPMTGEEYEPVWTHVSGRLATRGAIVDGAPKDGSRFWYLPSEPREGRFVFISQDGVPLDVDAVLRAVARERSRQAAIVRNVARPRTGSRYARAALERECDAVASAAKGMRNNRLNQAAYALARFVSAGDLGALEVRTALASAAKLAGLTGSEVTKTIRERAPGREGAMTWPELVPFDDADARDVPAFPLDALPKALAAFASTIAGNLLTPIDLPAVAALGVASAAVAGRVRLRLSADWYEPANTYLLAVLPPSLHKSPTLKLVTDPFEVEEASLVEQWRQAEAERSASRDEIKRELVHLGRKKPTPALNAQIRELRAKEAEHAATPRPELLTDDATSEALIRKLQHGPLFIASAEGRPFELMSGLYRNKGEDGADVYLKAWSGDAIRSSRVTSGDLFIPRPNLTLFLAVQPIVVAKLAGREDFRGRGLIARFMCCYPRTRVGYRDWRTTTPINATAKLHYSHSITSLLSLPRPEDGTATPLVALSPEAEAIFLAHRQELEAAQRKDALLREWQDLGGKGAGHCARLALVVHMAEHGPAGVDVPLSAATMTAAVRLTRYFVKHTIETWDGCSAEPLGARVVRWLEGLEPAKRATVTQRDLQRAFSRVFRKAAEARAMLVELAERGYVTSTDDPATWAINPRLYEPAVGIVDKRRRRGADSETPTNADESAPLAVLSALSAGLESASDTQQAVAE